MLRGRPKYIQHVRALYPNATQPQGKAQNLSGFLHFAMANPKYLPDIGAYLLHRIQKHIRRGDAAKVPIPVEAMCSLIESCDSDLTRVELWQDRIKAAVFLLLSESNYEYKIYGTKILAKYAKQPSSEEYQVGRLDAYFAPLLELLNYTDQTADVQQEVQVASLQALEQMLLNNDERSSNDHLNQIVPAILKNIQLFPDSYDFIDDQKGDTSPNTLSLRCLIQIARLVDLANIAKILEPVFQFLDERKWVPRQNSSACIRLITDNSRKLPNGYNICYETLRHLEILRKAGRMQFMEDILLTMSDVVQNMRLPIGAWEGIVRLLLQSFASAVDERNDSPNIREAYKKILGAYTMRMSNLGDQLKLIDNLCRWTAPKDLSLKAKEVYMECALMAAILRKKLSDNVLARVNVVSSLLGVVERFREVNGSASLISLAVKTVTTVLVDPQVDDSKENVLPLNSAAFINPNLDSLIKAGKSKVDDLIQGVFNGSWTANSTTNARNSLTSKDNLKLLRIFVYHDLVDLDNPATIHHFRLLSVMLHENPMIELTETVPMIIFILQVATDPAKFHADLYALVLSYFCLFVRLFSNMEFSSSVQGVCSQIDALLSTACESFNLSQKSCSITVSKGYVMKDSSRSRELEEMKAPAKILEKDGLIAALSQITIPQGVAEQTMAQILETTFKPSLNWYLEIVLEKEEIKADPESHNSIEDDENNGGTTPSAEPHLMRATSWNLQESLAGAGVNYLKEADVDDYQSLIHALVNDKDKQDAIVAKALQGTFHTEDRELVHLYDRDSSDEDNETGFVPTHSRNPSHDIDDAKHQLDMLDAEDDVVLSPTRPKSAHKSILQLPDEPTSIIRSKVNVQGIESPMMNPNLESSFVRKPTGKKK
eukprot:TRINITY_DN8787_c0_g1_i3.p1 TRINITY_DN8787_c0_g1~~TRINITY_DN8787_c0_g1_i3.p1  ORF type:complete len:884 (-),score=206.79 TRINITY_DN8787_c0_g1_i3:106-2757(-)